MRGAMHLTGAGHICMNAHSVRELGETGRQAGLASVRREQGSAPPQLPAPTWPRQGTP